MSEDEKKYVRSVMFESLRGLQDYLLFLKYGGENRSIPVTDVVDGMLEIVRYLDGETQNQQHHYSVAEYNVNRKERLESENR